MPAAPIRLRPESAVVPIMEPNMVMPIEPLTFMTRSFVPMPRPACEALKVPSTMVVMGENMRPWPA